MQANKTPELIADEAIQAARTKRYHRLREISFDVYQKCVECASAVAVMAKRQTDPLKLAAETEAMMVETALEALGDTER